MILFLILSNIFTFFRVEESSRKERQQYKRSIDSLKRSNILLQGAIIIERNNRKEYKIKDSIKIKQLEELNTKDKILIIEQKKALSKYKNMSGNELLNILDSLYDADNR